MSPIVSFYQPPPPPPPPPPPELPPPPLDENPDEPDDTGTALAKALETLPTVAATAVPKFVPDQPLRPVQRGW